MPCRPEIDSCGFGGLIACQSFTAPTWQLHYELDGAARALRERMESIPELQESFGVAFPGVFENEAPARRVTLRAFGLDPYEVTNSRFARFLEERPEWRRESLAASVAPTPSLSVLLEVELSRHVVALIAKERHSGERLRLIRPLAIGATDLLLAEAAPGVGIGVPRIVGPPESSWLEVGETLHEVLADVCGLPCPVLSAFDDLGRRAHVRPAATLNWAPATRQISRPLTFITR